MIGILLCKDDVLDCLEEVSFLFLWKYTSFIKQCDNCNGNLNDILVGIQSSFLNITDICIKRTNISFYWYVLCLHLYFSFFQDAFGSKKKLQWHEEWTRHLGCKYIYRFFMEWLIWWNYLLGFGDVFFFLWINFCSCWLLWKSWHPFWRPEASTIPKIEATMSFIVKYKLSFWCIIM